jgi:hypothetical protein
MVATHHVMRFLVMIFAPRGQAHVEANELDSTMASPRQGVMQTEVHGSRNEKWL